MRFNFFSFKIKFLLQYKIIEKKNRIKFPEAVYKSGVRPKSF